MCVYVGVCVCVGVAFDGVSGYSKCATTVRPGEGKLTDPSLGPKT